VAAVLCAASREMLLSPQPLTRFVALPVPHITRQGVTFGAVHPFDGRGNHRSRKDQDRGQGQGCGPGPGTCRNFASADRGQRITPSSAAAPGPRATHPPDPLPSRARPFHRRPPG